MNHRLYDLFDKFNHKETMLGLGNISLVRPLVKIFLPKDMAIRFDSIDFQHNICLYNKDCLIEYLLDKSKYENGPDYVKGLKDVKELNLLPNPSYDSNKQEKGDEVSALNRPQWICPITGLEMNGTFKFFFVYSCGCVFSERAFKTIQTNNNKCIKCEKSYSDHDLIVINANDEDLESNKEKLKLRKELSAKSKSDKNSSSSASASAGAASNSKDVKDTKESSKSSKSEKVTSSADSSASSSSKEEDTKKKRTHESVAASSKPSGSTNKATSKETEPPNSSKKLKTIQDDPNTSDTYKSLFTSCAKAKNQQKAHWVTFNPQYF